MEGNYSVSSGYKCLSECSPHSTATPSSSYIHSEASWKMIWKAKNPDRNKQFIWRLQHNAIATRRNLVRKKIASDPRCPICKMEEETIEHLLFLCPWTTSVWFGLQLCPVPKKENVTHFGDWIDSLVDPSWCLVADKDTLFAILMVTLWCIWKARNAMVFEDYNPNPNDILYSIKVSWSNYQLPIPLSRHSLGVSGSQRNFVARWRPPRGQVMKFNSDAQFDLGSGKGCTSIVGRNNLGIMVAGSTSKIFAFSALVAEASALREAISLVVSLQIPSVLLESDCLVLIEVCR